MALPDFSQPFTLECDASNRGIRAVLQQHNRPIAFSSKALGPKNQAISTYEKELIAIVYAIKKWQHYLQGRHFIIKTDHSSLKYFFGQRENTPFQHKWVSKLLGFDYEIQYKNGAENLVVDALSRVHVNEEKNTDNATLELYAISYPYLGWMDELRRYNEQDEWVKEKFKAVSDCIARGNTPLSLAKYSIDNGFLCYRRRVVLSPSLTMS